MAQHEDILIIGGGVIGLTTAWFLARQGVSVLVVEQGDIGKQASWAGAGIVPPGDPSRAHSPLDLLRSHSYALYPDLSAQLRLTTGIDNGFMICGGIEFPDPEEPGIDLPTEEWHSEGIEFRHLERQDLLRLQSGLSETLQHGAFLPGMAQVRNPHHLQALRKGCALLGVRFETNWPVRRLIFDGNQAIGVEGEHGKLTAGQFLLAAGAWTDALLRDLGCAPGIRPVRGQIVLLDTGQEGVRPLLLQGKRYLVPRRDGRILVGSTEEDAGFDARPTEEGIAGLLRFAYALVPSLSAVPIEAQWAGLRPGSPDGLPYMGAVPKYDRVHIASGHFRAGLQLSPASGLVMAQHLLGQQTLIPLEAFRLDRPPAPVVHTAFRS